MLIDKTVRGTNFTCFHAGLMESWSQFRLEPPDVPLPARGKLFLRRLLGSAGLEMSLNVVPPSKGIPFLHKHRQNDEVYVVVGGRGQFLVDSECIDVAEGSVLRLCPAAARAWKSTWARLPARSSSGCRATISTVTGSAWRSSARGLWWLASSTWAARAAWAVTTSAASPPPSSTLEPSSSRTCWEL